jgi:tRNA(fMet)-specific endonuclease VapC
MYLLDTDHLSLIQRGGVAGRTILGRLAATGVPFGTTIVTYEEQSRGWLELLGRARNLDEQVAAYQFLRQHAANYRVIDIVEFDLAAAQEFQRLRKVHRRLGTMDLKIAAIALTCGATVLTRNQSDFGQVVGLKTEDWARGLG